MPNTSLKDHLLLPLEQGQLPWGGQKDTAKFSLKGRLLIYLPEATPTN